MIKSSKPIDGLLRWVPALLGVAGAWLIPFGGEAPIARSFIALAGIAISAIAQYRASNRSKALEALVEATSIVAIAADTKAAAAIPTRRLSIDKQGKAAARLSGVMFLPLIARIGYVPTADESKGLADDIAGLLTSLGVTCQPPPIELRPEGGFPLTESGVRIGVVYGSPQPIKQLAEALKSEIPEAEITNGDQRGWANTGGAITTISIIGLVYLTNAWTADVQGYRLDLSA